MKTKRSGFALAWLAAMLLLTACGGGGGSGSGSNTPTYTLSGQFQKGPFAIGSQISVNELDESLNPTGKVYNVQTSDDLGNFTVGSAIGTHLVEIVGSGFYMDELTGNLASSQVQIRAVADLAVDSTPTVNILTALQSLRLKKLITQGNAYAVANTQSQSEVLTAFGIDPTKVNGLSTLYSMQINGNTDADSVLLAVSTILSRMATNAAATNATTQPAELSNYVNTIASQLENTGTISTAAIITAKNLAATQIDLAAVRTNVETYYVNRGVTIVAPKFEEWVDKDGSGILPRRLVPVTGLTFTDVPAADPGQLITSNAITVAGVGAGIVAPVSVNTATTIIKNNVAVTGTNSTAQNGDTLAFRVTSLGFGLTNTSTISVGSSSAVWTVTTKPLSGTIIGLTSSGLILQNNGGDNINIPAGSTSFNFPSGVAIGGSYNISVLTQPSNPAQNCTVNNGSGTVTSANVTNIKVECLWTATGSLAAARRMHTATLLPNGKVLVVGGVDSSSQGISLASAELFDPATGLWSATGSLANARTYHTATLLPNGKILVAGGELYSSLAPVTLTSAELYDPATGLWTPTGSFNSKHAGGTATLLPNGKVLVAGGLDFGLLALNRAELYDPATGLWTATGNLTNGRQSHISTLLSNGKVLIAGGRGGNPAGLWTDVPIAELYDPATGLWAATGSLNNAALYNQDTTANATLLTNGKVLVGYSTSTELFDPATGLWTATGSFINAGFAHTAFTQLPNGKVMTLSGAWGGAELYEPATGLWSEAGASANGGRGGFTATLLANGRVLVVGGLSANYASSIASCELY